MTEQPATDDERPERRGLIWNIGVNAVLPYATYLLLSWYGIATVPALVAGAVFPLTSTVVGMIRSRRVEALGIIVLVATGASVLGALWFTSPYLVLVKGSLMTGLIGLLFLGSLAAHRPLIYYAALAGQDEAARHDADAQWQAEPNYRLLMRRLTLAWGLAMMTDAILRVLLIPYLPIAVFLPVSELMWYALFGVMMAWSWRYGRRMMERMEPDRSRSA
jgi:hypothetical protein